jgi:hypothetical protein
MPRDALPFFNGSACSTASLFQQIAAAVVLSEALPQLHRLCTTGASGASARAQLDLLWAPKTDTASAQIGG